MLNQQRAPLFEQMQKLVNSESVRFHVPGHKGRTVYGPDANRWFDSILQIDWTEVPGLDNLHAAQSCIADAEQLAAECFGAEQTRFLVGGSTSGNLAAVLAICEPDDLLIVQRDSHQSVLNGLALARAKAVFVPSTFDASTGVALPVDPAHIEAALRKYPQAKGVFITCPNYYGLGSDLCHISELVHTYGKPLIVDEAHGAHYGFHSELPPSAISCGADLVIQSTHKMLPAMTMGSMIHMQGGRIPRQVLMQTLAAIQSSSPSYPIMASLDLARQTMAVTGTERLEQALAAIRQFERRASQSERWQTEPIDPTWLMERQPRSPQSVMPRTGAAQPGSPQSVASRSAIPGSARSKQAIYRDPFKLVIRDAFGDYDGFQLQAHLQRHGILVEMADPQQVLIACSLMTTSADLDRLWQVLSALPSSTNTNRRPGVRTTTAPVFDVQPGPSEPVRLRLHSDAPVVQLPLRQSIGKVAAEAVTPYPPGIPVVFPGETIAETHVKAIERWREAGARMQGCEDEQAAMLRVFADEA